MSDIHNVPERCFKCGTPMMRRQTHSILLGYGAEFGFALIVLAFFLPNWPLRIISVISGIALLFYLFDAYKDRRTGNCPSCNAQSSSGGDGAYQTKKYQLYYTFARSNTHVSGRDAPRIANLDELPEKLDRLRTPEDVVYAIIHPGTIRVGFRLTSPDEMHVQIDVPREARGYSRHYEKARIGEFTSALDDIVADPTKAGFRGELF